MKTYVLFTNKFANLPGCPIFAVGCENYIPDTMNRFYSILYLWIALMSAVPLCGKAMPPELFPKAETSDYCFPDEVVTRTDIGITYLGISCGPSSIEAMQSLVAGRPAYNNRTDLVLVAKAGMNVKVTPKGIGRGTHSFFFVDFNGDGVFTPAFGLTTHPAPGSELVSFDRMNRGEGYFDSADREFPDGDTDLAAISLPSFAIPADLAPGTYRMRYVNNMVSSNPCGISAYKKISEVGGSVIDVLLRVVTDYVTPYTVEIAANSDEAGTVSFLEPKPGESGANTLVTDESEVKVKAMPKGEAHFMYWTDISGSELSAEPMFTYSDQSDIKLIAWFGYAVTWTAGEGGTMKVTSDSGVDVNSGDVVAVDQHIRVSPVPDDGYEVESLMVNGEETDLTEEGEVSINVDCPLALVARFARKAPRLSIEAEGPGSVAVFTAVSVEGRPLGRQLRHGDNIGDHPQIWLFIYPDKNARLDGLIVETGGENMVYSRENLEYDADGSFYRLAVMPSESVSVRAKFSSGSAAIPATGEDSPEAVYYDLHGRRVSATALTPGIYIELRSGKARKILVR